MERKIKAEFMVSDTLFFAGVNFVLVAAGAFVISAILMKWKITQFLI